MTFRVPVLDLLLAASAAALGTLVYTRLETRSDVFTGVLFLLALGTGLAAVARSLLRLTRRHAYLPHVTLLVATFTLGFVGVDVALRYGVRTRLTYSESNGDPIYRSIYRYNNPTWYHLYGKNATINDVRTEFTHTRTTNSLGLTEREVPIEKPADEYRVLALGDSFTEGVGASYDDSWVRVLERQLSPLPDGRVVRAIDAGISGSDLFFQLVLFRDRLAAYTPDLVIVAMNNSDITDVMTRGGMERFRPDGRVRGDRGPWWDWLYGISFITRHVVHDVLDKSWLLLDSSEHAAAQAVARAELKGALHEIRALSSSLGATFVLAVTPHQYEVESEHYDPGFQPFVDELTAPGDSEIIDLRDHYAHGIMTSANAREYYWKLDFHHNAKGYALMGEAIAAEMRSRHLVPEAR